MPAMNALRFPSGLQSCTKIESESQVDTNLEDRPSTWYDECCSIPIGEPQALRDSLRDDS